MIKELREMRKKKGKELALANYISYLQHCGKIRLIVSEKGYACYDTEEFKAYKKTARRGRPLKINEEK